LCIVFVLLDVHFETSIYNNYQMNTAFHTPAPLLGVVDDVDDAAAMVVVGVGM
jgi:hypothetical protein